MAGVLVFHQDIAGAESSGLPPTGLLEPAIYAITEKEWQEAIAALDREKPAPTAQQRLELEFLNALMARPDRLPDLVPRVEAAQAGWKYGKSSILILSPEYLSQHLYLARVHLAMTQEKPDLLEKTIKEAFWTHPDMADRLGSLLVEHRRKESLLKLKPDMDRPLKLSGGGQTSLRKLLKGKKFLLLDFWATWCGPCMERMPALKEKMEKEAALGVVVAGINVEADAKKAESVRKEFNLPGPWLVDEKEGHWANLFLIESYPHMVLLDAKGQVAWSGHPDNLEQELAQLQEAKGKNP
ncbi:MAG: TlpA family protein disulfide reductase [Blastochloris sp.]|nr:TlpA family protein disulfide reductase [Blastochloris sp.]